jgi:ABC-type nitrate/sulfonate/bicarbonate transport system substrate-binding protein
MTGTMLRWGVIVAGALTLASCAGRVATAPTGQPATAGGSGETVAATTARGEATAEARASETALPPTDVTLMLDWVPNTNHTGIFVAQEAGYFADAGLEVKIIQPGEVLAQAAVASGAADFGVDFQEQVTMARADDRPLVSIAAIIQHNTSGFAARKDLGVNSPRDWAALRYGSFASPFEAPTLKALMTCDGGDFARLSIVDTGFADPLALLSEKRIDLAWIFYGWQGIQAARQGVDLDVVMMADQFDCVPDYYTPILITSEDTIARRPEVVRAFVGAVARGYRFAIDHPDEAAEALLRAAPELDRDLVRESQAWLSPRYAADAPRWGEQRREVWAAYARWMADNGVVNAMIDVDGAFTNAFLPAEGQRSP